VVRADQKCLGELLNNPMQPVHPKATHEDLKLVVHLGRAVLAVFAFVPETRRGAAAPESAQARLTKTRPGSLGGQAKLPNSTYTKQ